MARLQRNDDPGSLHHVWNRGIAKRTMFESRRDKRLFLSLVARAVRRGEIRVIAFCVMTTHFHLLVQSVDGRLDVAMQRIQTDYSRYFNRTRRRDGPLVRGRFASKRVDSVRYREALIIYIEANPISARMTGSPADYEFSSAFRISRGTGLIWLTESDVEFRRNCRALSTHNLESLSQLIEARLSGPNSEDPLDELLGATPERVLSWMRRKAELADGTPVGQPVCHSEDVEHAMHRRLSEVRAIRRPHRMAFQTMEKSMMCGLLRRLCGLRQSQIGETFGLSASGAGHLVRIFTQLLGSDDNYGTVAGNIARDAIRRGPFSSLGVESTSDEELVGFD